MFRPGQYALLNIAVMPVWRAYSMANLPNDEGEWRFVIKRVPGGTVSERLFDHLRIGDGATLDGPYGLAYLRPDAGRDAICIAGGSGFSPMLSIGRGLGKAGCCSNARCTFTSAVVRPVICRTRNWSRGWATRSARPVTSRRSRTRHRPAIRNGQARVAGCTTSSRGIFPATGVRTYEFYVSGPPPMVDAMVRLLLLHKQVPAEQVHYDRLF